MRELLSLRSEIYRSSLQKASQAGQLRLPPPAFLAAKAGIRVFATGGLGGVHQGANETFDESADLTTLATCPVVVVSAGVKSVLDISATLERLENFEYPGRWIQNKQLPKLLATDKRLHTGLERGLSR